MIHGARQNATSYCTAKGQASTDTDTITCEECLWHIASEALEGTGEELIALEAVRRIAELAHPELRITTLVGPVLPNFSDLAPPLATGEDTRA
jgi:hypothetical protein